MQDIRLFVTDLDGTLLNKDHFTISNRNRAALLELKQRGVALCACTGRVRCVLPPLIDEIGFDYAITSNGASCIDLHTGEHIFTAYMPVERARRAWDVIRPYDPLTEWFVNDEILMDRVNHAQWEARMRAPWHRVHLAAGKGIVVDDIHQYFDQGAPALEKISVFDCPKDFLEGVVEPLRATGEYEISTSLGINYEITDISADKGIALKTLCAHMRIDESESIAFGDGGNDRELIRAAGVSVAMGNALDSLKALADCVTLCNDEDGVAAALERYGLIAPRQ